jgi:hypothetical protein
MGLVVLFSLTSYSLGLTVEVSEHVVRKASKSSVTDAMVTLLLMVVKETSTIDIVMRRNGGYARLLRIYR